MTYKIFAQIYYILTYREAKSYQTIAKAQDNIMYLLVDFFITGSKRICEEAVNKLTLVSILSKPYHHFIFSYCCFTHVRQI